MTRFMPRVMRSAVALPLTLAASPVLAHTGHIGEVVAGHDHWVAGIALGIAAGVAIVGAIKSLKGGQSESDDEAASDEAEAAGDRAPQEA